MDRRTALSVTLFYILSDREVLSKLYAELLAHIPKEDTLTPSSILEHLPYLMSLPSHLCSFHQLLISFSNFRLH